MTDLLIYQRTSQTTRRTDPDEIWYTADIYYDVSAIFVIQSLKGK